MEVTANIGLFRVNRSHVGGSTQEAGSQKGAQGRKDTVGQRPRPRSVAPYVSICQQLRAALVTARDAPHTSHCCLLSHLSFRVALEKERLSVQFTRHFVSIPKYQTQPPSVPYTTTGGFFFFFISAKVTQYLLLKRRSRIP